jgi:uncharacterized protein GlcG (DUF336 family)
MAHAEDVFTLKTIGMELARDIASETVLACRKQGYAVSAAVVDRNAILKAALRDDLASRFTLQIAEEKANMAIMSGINSGEFRSSREDIRNELNHIDGLIVMQGGVIISAGGVRIGAVGVSGAPGGDLDEACALKALDRLIERLEFAD